MDENAVKRLKAVRIDLQRLQRHYEQVVTTYDEASLLDLSHLLRVWVELAGTLPSIAPAFGTAHTFRSAAASKPVYRAAHGRKAIICYVPEPIVTFAADGHLVGGPGLDETVGGDRFHSFLMRYTDTSLEIANFCYIDGPFDLKLKEQIKEVVKKRMTYRNWLGSEAVRVNVADAQGVIATFILSRETLVKRVANILGGSHPSVAAVSGNMFDPAVRCLMEWRLGGLPLPYFLLLKMAHDILEVAPKYLGLESAAPLTPSASGTPTPPSPDL